MAERAFYQRLEAAEPMFSMKFKSNKVKQPEKCSHWLLKSTNGITVPKKRYRCRKQGRQVKPKPLHLPLPCSLVPPLCPPAQASRCQQSSAGAAHTLDAPAFLVLDHNEQACLGTFVICPPPDQKRANLSLRLNITCSGRATIGMAPNGPPPCSLPSTIDIPPPMVHPLLSSVHHCHMLISV